MTASGAVTRFPPLSTSNLCLTQGLAARPQSWSTLIAHDDP